MPLLPQIVKFSLTIIFKSCLKSQKKSASLSKKPVDMYHIYIYCYCKKIFYFMSIKLALKNYFELFQSIPKEREFEMRSGKDPQNKSKNRFKNILPCKYFFIITNKTQQVLSWLLPMSLHSLWGFVIIKSAHR